jgi:hypothetical protein
MRPGYFRFLALAASAVVATPLLLRLARTHATAFGSEPSASLILVLGLGALPVLVGLACLWRVGAVAAFPPRAAGRFLLACVLGPLGVWLAAAAGPHAAADLLVLGAAVACQSALFGSALVANHGD